MIERKEWGENTVFFDDLASEGLLSTTKGSVGMCLFACAFKCLILVIVDKKHRCCLEGVARDGFEGNVCFAPLWNLCLFL